MRNCSDLLLLKLDMFARLHNQFWLRELAQQCSFFADGDPKSICSRALVSVTLQVDEILVYIKDKMSKRPMKQAVSDL